MNRREKVRRAISHIQTEETPWSLELTSGAAQNIKNFSGTDDLDSYLGNHMYRLNYKKNVPLHDGTGNEKDLFGVTWHTSNDGGDVGHIVGYPLKNAETIEDLRSYPFPDINKDLADEICRDLEEKSKDYFTMFSIGMCYFERAWGLREMANVLMDMCDGEEMLDYILDKTLEHHLKLLDYVLDRPFDGVYLGDDWGQQTGSIMGPERWRRFIKPGMKQMFDKIKQKGKYVIVHSCGNIVELLPDLIDMGLDVYNTVQPEVYDLRYLKREFGKDLTFYGGISTQGVLPFGTKKEVADKTKETLDIMFRDGGYILSPAHGITPDVPVENIMAIVETAKSYKY